MQRRFISAEAAAAWNSKVGRFVHPARNAELFEYQEKIKQVRKEYIGKFAGRPTKAQAAAEKMEAFKLSRMKEWSDRLEATKEKVKGIIEESTGKNLTQKHHPCRPHAIHTKTEEERKVNRWRLAEALRPALVMRRKYLKYLADTQCTWVTRENLSSKIDQAINNPTTYDIVMENAVASEMMVKERLRSIRVPDDRNRK